ncbi:MAG: DUF6265 family protein [Planctomycetota bacterium]
MSYRLLLISIVLMPICSSGVASDDTTPKEPAARETTIDDFAWIAGHWRGKAMGGEFEETWNPPLGDSMVGMFKLVKDGKTVFTEHIMLHKLEGRWAMRVKHFDEAFVAKEDKDKAVNFRLERIEKDQIVFDGLKMKRMDDDRMQIIVRVRNGDQLGELKFDGKRMKR